MRKITLSFLIIVALLSGCRDKNKDYLVKVQTEYGDMTILLYDETPLHKKNFLKLVKEKEYDSTIFHRILEDFMIQGGNVAKRGNEQIPAEIVDGFYHIKGALAAARQPDQVNPEKKSSATQYYIVDGNSWETLTTNVPLLNQKMGQLLQDPDHSTLLKQFQELAKNRDNKGMNKLALANKNLIEEKYEIDLSLDVSYPEVYKKAGGYPPLDGEYTVFGMVVEGLEFIDVIASVETKLNPSTGEKSTAINTVYVAMEVVEMTKKEVTKKYGYTYPSE